MAANLISPDLTMTAAEMPKVGNRYRLGNRSVKVRGIVDNMVVYRQWQGNRYEYHVVDAWLFKAEVGIMKKLKGAKKVRKDKLTKEQERVLRVLYATDDWMTAHDLKCQMGTLYSLSSRRNYVVRDVVRAGDILLPRINIHWQITTVGREVVEQLDSLP